MIELDELKIFKGDSVKINNNITLTIPTINQIVDFGEQDYFNAVYTFSSVGADMKWQLWDLGIDYTEIDDYDLFIQILSRFLSSKKEIVKEYKEHPENFEQKFDDDDLNAMLKNPLELILQDIDLSEFGLYKLEKNGEIILYNVEKEITIDKLAYHKMVDVIRLIHGFKRNNQKPANEWTKMDLIEDARDEAMMKQNEPFKSILKPLISTLQVYSGQCGDERIWNMPISMFFENVKRVNKIQDAKSLMQGAYSGFADLKGIDKERFDMFSDT